jgi:hypothetical protein
LATCLANRGLAKVPDEAEFQAAGVLGDKIGTWIGGMDPKPGSIGIFSVHSNAPLDQDYSNVVETEIMKGLSQQGFSKVFSCTECRTPQINVEEEKVVISKGNPDVETFKKLGQSYNTDVFLVVEVFRTTLSVVAQAVLYQNSTGAVLSAERFTVAAITFSDSAVQVLLTYGLGEIIGGNASSDNSSGLSTAANVMLLEEVGFGKAGLDLGAVLGVNGAGTMIYINPTLAFRGHIGNSGLGWSLMFGAGYGFVGSAKGLSLRAGYEVFLGQLAVLGFEGTYLLSQSSTPSTLPGYVGFHVGIALGR